MKWETWFSIDWQQLLGISLSAVGFYIGLMLFTRLMGLRSFSKLSSHDFAMTVGIGSILASTVLADKPSLLQGLFAVAMLFLIQGAISIVRRKIKPLKALIDNRAIILMAHGEYFSDNLKEANLTTSDVQEVLLCKNLGRRHQCGFLCSACGSNGSWCCGIEGNLEFTGMVKSIRFLLGTCP